MSDYQGYAFEEPIQLSALAAIYDIACPSGFRCVREGYPFWEVLCVLEGEVGVSVRGAVYYLSRGLLTVHRPMEDHHFWPEGKKPTRLAVIDFRAALFPALNKKVYLMSPDDFETLSELIARSCQIFELAPDRTIVGTRADFPFAVARFVNRLEHFLLNVLGSENKFSPSLPSVSAKKYAMIVDVMKENLDKSLTISQLADLCSMSPSNLKKIFSGYSSAGVISYFNSLKVSKAIAMLSEGSRICEIAAELGFEEQNYFSAFFKRMTGYSPLHYQRRFLNL